MGDSLSMETGTGTGSAKVLLVDDDEAILRGYSRLLTKHGFQVVTAGDGDAAQRALTTGAYDVIVTDIDMPKLDGIELLERARRHDLDVPVLLVTGAPTLETAIQGVERGALRYLLKPVDPGQLIKAAADAVRLRRIARAKREALDLAGGEARVAVVHHDLAARFDRALASLRVAYQPIVSLARRSVFAYEGLLRSDEASLPHPGAILDAAERLGRVWDVGRAIRQRAIVPLERMPRDALLFLNLHPADLLDPQLYDQDTPFTAVAGRLVLEVTERASLTNLDDVAGRATALRELGFRVAIDDLGAGYSGLTSFALLEPDIVKLDMVLVRNLDRQPTKQTMVRTVLSMCRELGIRVIAEGIERPEERDALARVGCDLMQGYLFARPGDAFPPASFAALPPAPGQL
jgi:EAL domain-containing protein (putative c-di-GMP-specific phosphodiesterase class I)